HHATAVRGWSRDRGGCPDPAESRSGRVGRRCHRVCEGAALTAKSVWIASEVRPLRPRHRASHDRGGTIEPVFVRLDVRISVRSSRRYLSPGLPASECFALPDLAVRDADTTDSRCGHTPVILAFRCEISSEPLSVRPRRSRTVPRSYRRAVFLLHSLRSMVVSP